MRADVNRIHGGLWQGSRPASGDFLSLNGFSMVILCAKEHQPPAEKFPGTQVIYAPNDDDFTRLPTREELLVAIRAARQAVPVLQDGGNVLSTCWMGWNRSGLVSAITLHLWLGVDGRKAIQMVREGRRKALRNPGFLSVLEKLPGLVSPPPTESARLSQEPQSPEGGYLTTLQAVDIDEPLDLRVSRFGPRGSSSSAIACRTLWDEMHEFEASSPTFSALQLVSRGHQ